MEQEDFKKQIDELFRLFNKMMEQHPIEDVPGIDRLQLEQMRLFLKNYKSMKDQISFEMMGQMNEPMKQMIGMFIKQLRQELGEDEPYTIIEQPEALPSANSIEKIDEMLRQPGLGENEIDQLLDERARLIHKKNQQ
ncbi:MAG: hypothetical protein CVT92_11400 [Bacteroidetes bacterium HGW-Bacteroidetes-1]|jgi:hypothetical protein|nr:MAG: hypothetical protein CVT92_11400 [Bacteroidetes bacterium HGW-Bacteroidetes-1]